MDVTLSIFPRIRTTGTMAAAQLKGMGKYGVTGTIKHFACNNQGIQTA